ncbi:MAG: response regulator [Candidatus Manganitrophus sp.]|nr:response regulator [Candidatus Manganitrophus sp.]WDT72080.1 MAG: response regulator [Candidatus Manganitrophus sp.]WDT75679.1 MAG: response regulator [Candidatus Manganitrophus sp.]WDT80516.1 MAG: response regulator [Candidatus Manganitrophus sp.]
MKEKVLIVDDTEFYQKAYKNKLLSAGYITSVANNGVEALKALTTDKPDLILLDLMMPIMDGFKVLQTVKANPNLQSIPVIVFSAKGASEEISKALQAGASDFLVKATTTPNKVVEKIKEILQK